jgi:hypothetical protein
MDTVFGVLRIIKNTGYLILRCIIYPNPAGGHSKPVFESNDYENLSFRFYDFSGAFQQVNRCPACSLYVVWQNAWVNGIQH